MATLAKMREKPARQTKQADKAGGQRHIPGGTDGQDGEGEHDLEHDRGDPEFLHRQIEAGLHQQRAQGQPAAGFLSVSSSCFSDSWICLRRLSFDSAMRRARSPGRLSRRALLSEMV